MSFFLLDCDEQSHFYAATETGALVFYQDLARNGTGIWAFGVRQKPSAAVGTATGKSFAAIKE